LFSLFGAKENRSGLIPSLIIKLMKEKEMDLTLGMQKYAYLYVKDFSQIVTRIVNGGIESGVYNISSNKVLSLKDIIQYIATVVNPEFKLNFGAVEYRKNQSMHIEGDISKLVHQIGPVQFSDFDTSINETIEYYTSKKSQE
jgi:dTDP-D-glucose 4,6-dehydratase